MVQLVIGKTYNTQELAKALGVSRETFSKKKNEYLNSLSQAYEYEVGYKGRAILYTITSQIGDFQKPERKNAREKNDAVIHQFIRDVIEEDDLQTAANMGRRAFESFVEGVKTDVAKLGLTEGTTKEYIRLQMREMFGTQVGENNGGTDGFISEKVWCRLNAEYNIYEELSGDIIADYLNIVKETKAEVKLEAIDAYEDYMNGNISKQEWMEIAADTLGDMFKISKQKFAARYGYYPIKVPRYQLNAWQNKECKYDKNIAIEGDFNFV